MSTLSIKRSKTLSLLERARALDYDFIHRGIATRLGISQEQAEEDFDELLKFLCLSSTNRVGSYGMPPTIDPIWHEFILFTREYHKFCKTLFGRYLHHTPNLTKADEINSEVGYQSFLEDYRAIYGKAAPQNKWPTKVKIDCLTDDYTPPDCQFNYETALQN